MRCRATSIIFSLVLLLTSAAAHADSDPTLHIAVAANFKATLQDISAAFTAATDIPVTLSAASSGALANQILRGAPFHLFFAADLARPQAVYSAGDNYPAPPFCYAVGRLVLAGADDGLARLARPELSLAIANPDTAPYGHAALSVLSREEFRAGQGRKLVRAGNVLQAYQYWYTGTVDLALLPASLAAKDATPIPRSWHQPLRQYALVLREGPAVNAYLHWLKSDRVRSLVQQAGYEPCP